MNINNYFGSPFSDLTNVGGLVTVLLNILFVVAGLILLFYFILGGYGMISSAGKNDPKQMEQSKQTLTTAVIGFVVVIAAYWIVKLLAQLLGVPNLLL